MYFWSDEKEKWRQDIGINVLRILEKCVGPFKGKVILDIGCGFGENSYSMKKSGAYVYGVDPDKKAIQYAVSKGYLDADKTFNTTLQKLSSTLYHKFDIATIWLFCIPYNQRETYFQALQKYIKPGGIIIIGVTDKCFADKKNGGSFFHDLKKNFYSVNQSSGIGWNKYIFLCETPILFTEDKLPMKLIEYIASNEYFPIKNLLKACPDLQNKKNLKGCAAIEIAAHLDNLNAFKALFFNTKTKINFYQNNDFASSLEIMLNKYLTVSSKCLEWFLSFKTNPYISILVSKLAKVVNNALTTDIKKLQKADSLLLELFKKFAEDVTLIKNIQCVARKIDAKLRPNRRSTTLCIINELQDYSNMLISIPINNIY